MNARFERLVLLALALSAAFVGLWALLAPASFYTGFPGAARHWVAVDGPFNEHMVRDIGALNCALCVLSMVALLHPERALVRATGLTWLIFAMPHLAYHADHLRLYNRMDQVLNLVSLWRWVPRLSCPSGTGTARRRLYRRPERQWSTKQQGRRCEGRCGWWHRSAWTAGGPGAVRNG
jgi:hypothetical protein